MKDTRFVALINLYIDRQITPAEAAELEAEINANPRRRQVYHGYCRMHRATRLVYESFRSEAGTVAGDAPTTAKVTQWHGRRVGAARRWTWIAGGMAAAACLALVVLRTPPGAGAGAAAPLPTADAVLAAVAALEVAPGSIGTRVPESAARASTPGIASLRAGVVTESDYAAAMTAYRQDEQRLAAAFTQPAGAPRLSFLFDDGVFEGRSQVLPVVNTRSFKSRQRSDLRPVTEFTAFQFQR